MKKTLVQASFIMLILLSAGCDVIVKKGYDETKLTGTDGLTIKIERYPKEMYIGQGAQIPVTLENKGTAKAENAILVLGGYDPNYVKFRTQPRFEGINLEGKSLLVPTGGRDTKIFTITSISLPNEKEKTETFQAVACYQYTTEASPVVCINPKLAYGVQAVESGCNFEDAKITQTQGAPVAVARVNTVYFLDSSEVEFRLYVQDVGKGNLIDKNAYAKKCLSIEPLTKDEKGLIYIEAYLGNQPIPCYLGNNEVSSFKIANEGYSVVCRAKIDTTAAAYTTPLSLYLDYGYVVADEFTIKLKNPQFKE